MTEDFYVIAIAALLPLTACMLVFQVNPYHALVIRGILGAIAALVYALFGAADVALTEALVGTMLSITLYAVAVRSSLSMRLGVMEDDLIRLNEERQLLSTLRRTLDKYHMRLELVTYSNLEMLQAALTKKEIHTLCVLLNQEAEPLATDQQPPYYLQTRVERLYEILQSGLSNVIVGLSYIQSPLNFPEATPVEAAVEPVEVRS